MTKIGVISDIHGNYDALVAVLKLLEQHGCQEIIHTGDVVDIGPESFLCMQTLLSYPNVTLLLGNHDRDFALNEYQARRLSHVPTEHKQQVFSTLTESQREAVKQFPLYVRRNCGGKDVLFCHYAFKQNWAGLDEFPFCDIATHPTAQIFDKLFDGISFDAVFFGHKHEPCDMIGERLYVDVGSVGCHPAPIARAIVIEYDDVNFSYKRVSTPYDMQAVRDKMYNDVACGKHLFDFYFLRKNTPPEVK